MKFIAEEVLCYRAKKQVSEDHNRSFCFMDCFLLDFICDLWHTVVLQCVGGCVRIAGNNCIRRVPLHTACAVFYTAAVLYCALCKVG